MGVNSRLCMKQCVVVAVLVCSVVAGVHGDCGCSSGLTPSCSLQTSGISGNGTFVLHSGGSGATVSGSSTTFKHNNRGYLGVCTNQWSPTAYTHIPLLGKTITMTVDLSNVGCGCNVGAYFVAMPAIGPSGQPTPSSSGDYYCDANEVGGTFCPEIDLFEANNEALQATPHKCDAPWSNGHYTNCDRGGCAQNTYKNNPQSYGPGGQYTIDTTQPFQIATSFGASGRQLTSITTTLSQNGKTFTMYHTDSNCGSGYLEALTQPVTDGMVLVFSSWGDQGSTMSWLDVPPCNEGTACNGWEDAITYSDIIVN